MDGQATEPLVRERIQVNGIVQGVGFRPFVYRLAHELGLTGGVENTVHGVLIEAAGPREALDELVRRIERSHPPMARIDFIERSKMQDFAKKGGGFVIRESQSRKGRTTLISPDACVCEDCLAEMRDPADRRFRYPFINCTNCGPRYTIIRDIPYDRANTTMASFEMCPACRAEFEDPLDRRFHAQPNACPVCGPRVSLAGPGGSEAGAPDPICEAGRLLLEGNVLAVKGLGGFHLAVDAASGEAVGRLRSRKKRQGKPFAVMAPDVEAVERFCLVSSSARELLESPERPIVLLPKREGSGELAAPVAPGQSDWGVMLPYTPLHYLLLDAVEGRPLVMTSGNFSDEPIEMDNDSAIDRLAGIADCFLVHDRPIFMRADDSVAALDNDRPFTVRRSRGYVPRPVRLSTLRHEPPPVLATGGQLKNTVCLLRGRDAFLSQHVGDIERLDTYRFFLRTVEQLKTLLEVAPETVACDMHPDYLTTRWALEHSGLHVVRVQHHHAHMVSCMAENGMGGRVLGVCLDGTGYGTDGTVWGGEFLAGDERSFERVAHLPVVPLPGGEAAIRETWRTARSVFGAALGFERLDSLELPVWKSAGRQMVATVDRMIETGVNCPLSSGCGRYFDAVAALVGLRSESLYEGQAAIELESLAGSAQGRHIPEYPVGGLKPENGSLVPDMTPLLEAIALDVASGRAPASVAAGFQRAMARLTVETASSAASEAGVTRMVLSGGVFNNRFMLREVRSGLTGQGFEVYTHRQVPPGDGGISLGQAVVAAFAASGQ